MSAVAANSATLPSPYASDVSSSSLVYHLPSSSRRRTKSGNDLSATCVGALSCSVGRSRSVTNSTPTASSNLNGNEEERQGKAAKKASPNDRERRRNSPSSVRRRKCATAAGGIHRSAPSLYLGARLEYYAMNEESADIWLSLPAASGSSSFPNLGSTLVEEWPASLNAVDCSTNTLTCSANVAVIPLKSCLAKPKALLICDAQESVPHEALDLSSLQPNINLFNSGLVSGESYDHQMDNACDEGYCSPTSSCTLEVESIIVSRKAKTFTINISLPINSSDEKEEGKPARKDVLDQFEKSTEGVIDKCNRLISTAAENYPSILSKKEQQTTEYGQTTSGLTPYGTVTFSKSKKKVKFADDCGMNLINVRIMSDPLEESYSPKINPNAIQDKCTNPLIWTPNTIIPMFSNLEISQTQNSTLAYCQSNQCQNTTLLNPYKAPTFQSNITAPTPISPKIEPNYEWVPEFKPPISDYQAFSDRLNNLNIALESVRVKAVSPVSKLIASVRVKNVTPAPVEKYVFARVTNDAWRSYVDVPCEYVPAAITSFGAAANVDDQYMFEMEMPRLPPGALDTGFQALKRVEFAVCLKVTYPASYEKWDNNDGKNYCLSPRATLPLTQPLVSANLGVTGVGMLKGVLSRRGQTSDPREGPSRSSQQVQIDDNQAPYW